jgi:hypothetical protein
MSRSCAATSRTVSRGIVVADRRRDVATRPFSSVERVMRCHCRLSRTRR